MGGIIVPVMTTLSLKFDSTADLQEAVAHLWDNLAMSGELMAHPLADGCWRLDVVSEKTLRATTLEKLKGRRTED